MAFGWTRYGRRELAAATAGAAAVCALAAAAGWRWSWWVLLAAGPVMVVWGWVLWFFRDPERRAPAGAGLFVSPADGRVADITPVAADGLLGCEGVRVGIFMDIFNVHVNRCPESARVESVVHHAGAFLDVRHPDAPERNESVTIHLRCRWGGRELPVVVRQIAGLVARRIVTDLVAGQELDRGQRIGMIKFGSRLELWAPPQLAERVCVKVGDRVRAGETVLLAARKEQDGDSDA